MLSSPSGNRMPPPSSSDRLASCRSSNVLHRNMFHLPGHSPLPLRLLTPAHTSLHLFTSVHTSSHKLTLAHTSSTGSHQLLQLTPAPPGPSAQIAPPAHTAYICSHQLTPALPAHASSTRTTNTTSSTSSTSSYQLTPAHTS